MNRQTEINRVRFMLGEHANVLDRACSTMEIVDAANASGYRGKQDEDSAWEFLKPKIKAAVDALERLKETDSKTRAAFDRIPPMTEEEFSDFLASIDCTDERDIAEYRREFTHNRGLAIAA